MDEAQLAPGDAVNGGKYVIRKVLAVGGFALIYAAVRVETDDLVALKILRKSAMLDDDAAVARFEREAKLALELRHPHNVRVLGIGTTHDRHLYLAMELLRGRNLEAAIRAGEDFLPERAHTVLVQLLGALDEIHGLGVVHRDVKPANIFLTDQPGGMDSIKLLDYGFAKVLEDSDYSDNITLRLTRRGFVLGTPGYLAPEVCDGAPVTQSADLYAAGLVAYELLAGRVAYSGSPMERTQAQVRGNPPPLDKKLRKLAFTAVVERLMERRPSRRFASARDAIDALEAIDHPRVHARWASVVEGVVRDVPRDAP